MAQDKESGAAASRWGLETARQVASQLGATMKEGRSNEAFFKGQRVVIKCAAVSTDKVGVTYKMLEKLDSVIAAFEDDDGALELWSLQTGQFRAAMHARSQGEQGMVRRDFFRSDGKFLRKVFISAASNPISSYLAYWKPSNVDWEDPSSQFLNHAASNQLRKVAHGDVLYPITYRGGAFYLLGRIVVDRVTNQAQAARLLAVTKDQLWEADWHAVAAKPVMRTVTIPFTRTLERLELTSGGKVGPLVGPNGVQRFRKMREVTAASAAILDSLVKDLAGQQIPLRDLDIHQEHVSSTEGKRLLRIHLSRERDPKIVALKKRAAASLACEACGLLFRDRYGPSAPDYCEVHHLLPLAQLKGERETRLEDLAILCANCHRVAHLRTPPFRVKEIRKMLQGI
jgi:predicted HNH restriction endonuclease